ncbi:MAG: hypothetical protein H0W56_00065 [Acidothermales bacterium]|jgi:cytoskeletal protein RodZ|nr:hypothetical protein [Acidothermales bacterium]
MASALLFLPVIVVVLGLVALAVWSTYRAEAERFRIAQEVQLADWRLKQLSRAAMRQMLDEARRAQ